ncbi:MAG TPA: DUF6134 family protein [Stellaceae bacterium]|nr:DUF6134 family protein [Stellaceae bacterium]
MLGAVLFASGPAAAGPPDPLPLYGHEMVFSVWRKGDKIGQHRVLFAHQDGALVVRSILDLAVKILGITVYRYDYRAQETWRNGKLVALASTVDDNGTSSKVKAAEAQGKLDVTGPDGSAVINGAILPSTHWDAQVIHADRVLNTLDGKLDHIALVPKGVEGVATNDGERQAMHYLWTGDVKAESWYDAAGHWLKLRFLGKDGTPIEYICMRCLAAAP